MDEPCAIIDSFVLACQLYKETAEQRYADYANYILYNGIYRSTKRNGGFGTDNCAGRDDYIIQPTTRHTGAVPCEEEKPFAVSQHNLLERGKGHCHDPPVGIYQVKDNNAYVRTIPNPEHLQLHII